MSFQGRNRLQTEKSARTYTMRISGKHRKLPPRVIALQDAFPWEVIIMLKNSIINVIYENPCGADREIIGRIMGGVGPCRADLLDSVSSPTKGGERGSA